MAWFLLSLMTLLQNQPVAADLVVIVHPDNQTVLVRSDIQRIYLNRKKRWADGVGIVSASLGDGPVHRLFLEKYIGKSAAQFSTYWKRVIFTGRGTPPRRFEHEEDLVAFIASTPGAIGYVTSGTKLEGVRVLELP